MLKFIALGAASACLVLGAAAVAQTANPNDNNNPPAASSTDQTAQPADQNGANGAAMNQGKTAGERG
jgi:hypothetical protein